MFTTLREKSVKNRRATSTSAVRSKRISARSIDSIKAKISSSMRIHSATARTAKNRAAGPFTGTRTAVRRGAVGGIAF